MTKTASLKQVIEQGHFEHPSFKAVFDLLCSRIDLARVGGEPKVSWVVGPSRVGKSHLIAALTRKYPDLEINGQRRVPVVPVGIPSSISPQLLPMVVLDELKAPYSITNGSAGKLTKKMCEQLELAESKVIIFDEASHLVEPGARVLPYAAADWFKDVGSTPGISQILVGIPRLRKLLDASNQLRLRSFRMIEWRPYDSVIAADQKAFAGCVKTFLELFCKEGWSIDLPLEVIVKNCYLHAPGLVGKLRDLMVELADQLKRKEPRALGLADFFAASSALESAGHPNYPAFAKVDVAQVELSQAYQHVLSSNDML